MAPTESSAERLADPVAPQIEIDNVKLGPRPDITITEIRFVGAGVPSNVARTAQRFVGKNASAENLTKLAAAMTKAYNRSSVALFTLVIPEQDLSGGVVKVASAEGHVTSVVLAGETAGGPTTLVQKMVTPLIRLQPLSRMQFERTLGNVEDIPGLDVKTSIRTSGEQGGVVLGMELDAKRPTIGFGYTSRTSRFIRDGIFEGNARGYSLLRPGDETALTGAASVNVKSLLYLSLNHDTPVGAGGTRLGLSAAALMTRPVGQSIKGEAWSSGLSLRHPVIRGIRRSVSIGASFDYLDARNALFGSQIAAERTWIAGGNILLRLSEERTAAAVRIALASGLDIFNANIDANAGDIDFRYMETSVEANQLIGKRILLRFAGIGRWTGDRLPGAQRFSVGGATFGRAFDDGLVNGDRGYAGFAELAYRPFKNGKFTTSEIYSFADYADVTLLSRNLNSTTKFRLGSWGGGARIGYSDKGSLGVEMAKAWKLPAPGIGDDWRVAVSWKLSIRP